MYRFITNLYCTWYRKIGQNIYCQVSHVNKLWVSFRNFASSLIRIYLFQIPLHGLYSNPCFTFWKKTLNYVFQTHTVLYTAYVFYDSHLHTQQYDFIPVVVIIIIIINILESRRVCNLCVTTGKSMFCLTLSEVNRSNETYQASWLH